MDNHHITRAMVAAAIQQGSIVPTLDSGALVADMAGLGKYYEKDDYGYAPYSAISYARRPATTPRTSSRALRLPTWTSVRYATRFSIPSN